MNLRKQIKKEMDRQKINTSQMARRIDCAQQTLYNYFAGGNMTARYIEALINELGGKIIFTAKPQRNKNSSQPQADS